MKKWKALREQLLNDKTILTVEDFGAGSVIVKANQRSIASIAKNSGKPKNSGNYYSGW